MRFAELPPTDHYKAVLRYLWDVEISSLNNNMPRDQISLQAMLAMERPQYELLSGEVIDVAQQELETLKHVVPWLLHEKVFLPFVFQKRKGYWVFTGSKLEHWIVDRMLEFTTCSPFLLESYSPIPYYYQHHVYRFKRLFPSLSILTFTYG